MPTIKMPKTYFTTQRLPTHFGNQLKDDASILSVFKLNL